MGARLQSSDVLGQTSKRYKLFLGFGQPPIYMFIEVDCKNVRCLLIPVPVIGKVQFRRNFFSVIPVECTFTVNQPGLEHGGKDTAQAGTKIVSFHFVVIFSPHCQVVEAHPQIEVGRNLDDQNRLVRDHPLYVLDYIQPSPVQGTRIKFSGLVQVSRKKGVEQVRRQWFIRCLRRWRPIAGNCGLKFLRVNIKTGDALCGSRLLLDGHFCEVATSVEYSPQILPYVSFSIVLKAPVQIRAGNRKHECVKIPVTAVNVESE